MAYTKLKKKLPARTVFGVCNRCSLQHTQPDRNLLICIQTLKARVVHMQKYENAEIMEAISGEADPHRHAIGYLLGVRPQYDREDLKKAPHNQGGSGQMWLNLEFLGGQLVMADKLVGHIRQPFLITLLTPGDLKDIHQFVPFKR